MPAVKRPKHYFYATDLEEEEGRLAIFQILLEVIVKEEYGTDVNYTPLPSRFSGQQILEHYKPEVRFPKMVSGVIIRGAIGPQDPRWIYKSELLDAKDRIIDRIRIQGDRVSKMRAAALEFSSSSGKAISDLT